ncbi:conserved exported hypothetical protein [uncultured Alphaproteobacteria bacterium]|uniref:Uncharacterized protein n=1 Tax=uncultured Alphaproteobacteria bacterium TaxID=91750 RepID=A0A212KC30_9PROT|nr:conserved exported hypothetical protein [uncultured Alphaproteobacteria bacterium]
MNLLSRLAKLFGVELATVAWVGFGLALVAAVAATGVLVHIYDQATHEAVISKRDAQDAERDRQAALVLAEKTAETLAADRAARQAAATRDELDAKLTQAREDARVEGVRLSADLRRALERERLWRAAFDGRNGDAAAAGTGAGTPGCEDVRASRDRAIDALEHLQEGGDRIAEIGQAGVDAATAAARKARAGSKGVAHD